MSKPEGDFIIRGRAVLESGICEQATVSVQDGKIVGIVSDGETLPEENMRPQSDDGAAGSSRTESSGSSDRVIDMEDGILLPGFIDVHVHGGVGFEFMDATKEAYDAITRFHSMHGTTTMLATTVTAAKEALDQVLKAVASYQSEGMPFARLLGVHLEGPFISPKWPGAQNPAYIVEPQPDWFDPWLEQFPGLIKLLTLAPETNGALALIKQLREQGIICACGHTDASYDQMLQAVEHGLEHAVHTFNAMTGLHHREPGTVGAVLSDQRISAEIIADGHHVHPACIRLLTQLKNEDNLLLITDAVAAAGLSDGIYSLGELDVVVKDGVVRLKEGGNLAGSTLTMIGALRFMVQEIGLSLTEASRLASFNPAKLLGIADEAGSIAIGKRADFVLVSPELEIRQVWVGGKPLIAG